MIIICINCNKKFEVNSDLIPSEGRTIQCGSCNHVWFFKKSDQNQLSINDDQFQINQDILDEKNEDKKPFLKPSKKTSKLIKDNRENNIIKKKSEIIKYKPKSNFTFFKFLSYLLVLIISFIAIILILDTFKYVLYDIFPNLEIILYSLYETLKDIQLFMKDLI